MRRSAAAILAAGAVAIGSAAPVLPQAFAAAEGCRVQYTIASQWQGGFQANVQITNLGDAISSWSLGFAFPNSAQRLTQGWNATWSQSGANVTATNVGWNGNLATNASASIGFTGSWSGSNPTPAPFTLNGVACTGGVTNPTTGAPPPTTPAATTPAATTPPPPTGTTPVAINGQLRVCGVNLCNQYNRPIQLRGMSTHGIQWFGSCYNNNSLDALANDWKADLFRVSMYVQEQGYETNPTAFTNQVNNLVDMATARGMYALIDFHILTPGDPNYNLERAKTFFAAVSARHANKNNVIYEIANEPNGVSWQSIKSYAEQVIPVIRGNDPDGIVIVGTRGWSSLGVSEGSNETEVINNPVNAQNVMYAFHFYAASHQGNYRDAVSRAASRIPLFVTEFGTVDYTGNGPFDQASSTTWLNLLDSLKISYANWTFSDHSESSAALLPGTCSGSNYTGTGVLKASGQFIRSRIMTPDNFPTS
ncbi:cellulase family glycosylhydrolase [Micromonospora sp. CPCC 205371]|nr:cellulase family glycosylhydrolase [Micromonospora sp. CPCC 205371]